MGYTKPETAKRLSIKFRKKRRDIILRIKDVPCADCGNKFPPECMDFDHREGTEKKNKVTYMVCMKMELLMDEIAKCDIVCANCHRIRTRNRAEDKWYPDEQGG